MVNGVSARKKREEKAQREARKRQRERLEKIKAIQKKQRERQERKRKQRISKTKVRKVPAPKRVGDKRTSTQEVRMGDFRQGQPRTEPSDFPQAGAVTATRFPQAGRVPSRFRRTDSPRDVTPDQPRRRISRTREQPTPSQQTPGVESNLATVDFFGQQFREEREFQAREDLPRFKRREQFPPAPFGDRSVFRPAPFARTKDVIRRAEGTISTFAKEIIPEPKPTPTGGVTIFESRQFKSLFTPETFEFKVKPLIAKGETLGRETRDVPKGFVSFFREKPVEATVSAGLGVGTAIATRKIPNITGAAAPILATTFAGAKVIEFSATPTERRGEFFGETAGELTAFGIGAKAPSTIGQAIRGQAIKVGAEFVPPERVFAKEVLESKQTFPTARTPKEALGRFQKQLDEVSGRTIVVHSAPTPIGRQPTIKAGEFGAKLKEDPGLFVTPRTEGSPHFLGLSREFAELSSSLSKISRQPIVSKPTVVEVGVTGVKRQPRSVIESPGFEATAKFLEGQAGKGRAFITRRFEKGQTSEIEAIIPVGTKLVPDITGTGFKGVLGRLKGFEQFTEFRGVKVPIRKFRTVSEKVTAKRFKEVSKQIKEQSARFPSEQTLSLRKSRVSLPGSSGIKISDISSVISGKSKPSRTSKISRTSNISRVSRVSDVSRISDISRISRPSRPSRPSDISRISDISRVSRPSRPGSPSRISRITDISIPPPPPPTRIKLPELEPGKKKKKKKGKFDFERTLLFQPTITAREFNITAKKIPSLLTGLEDRPIIKV